MSLDTARTSACATKTIRWREVVALALGADRTQAVVWAKSFLFFSSWALGGDPTGQTARPSAPRGMSHDRNGLMIFCGGWRGFVSRFFSVLGFGWGRRRLRGHPHADAWVALPTGWRAVRGGSKLLELVGKSNLCAAPDDERGRSWNGQTDLQQ